MGRFSHHGLSFEYGIGHAREERDERLDEARKTRLFITFLIMHIELNEVEQDTHGDAMA